MSIASWTIGGLERIVVDRAIDACLTFDKVFWLNSSFRPETPMIRLGLSARIHRLKPCHLIGGLCVYFSVLAALGLHGSSIDMQANQVYSSFAPVVGVAKGIRIDEWSTHTPSILNQFLRPDPFALRDSPVGNSDAALLYNIPVRSGLMIFRPQFWSFFILPLESAFAVYWQLKSLFLLSGVFLLLVALTGETLWSFLLSLFFYFSAHTQWAFSWPTLLPEMIGSATLAVAILCLSLTASNRFLILLGSAAAGMCTANFALCTYPPHQIPIAWVATAVFIWFVITNRIVILTSGLVIWRIIGVFLFFLIFAVAISLFLTEAWEALTIAAHTVYPGSRVSSGGAVSPIAYLSDFLDFWKTQLNTTQGLGNICEGTGFLWFGILVLFFAPWLKPGRGRTLYFTCLGLFLAFSTWIFLPVPSSAGLLFGMHLVEPGRVMPAMGLLNVLMLGAFLTSYESNSTSVALAIALTITITAAFYIMLTFAQTTLMLELAYEQVAISAILMSAVLLFIYTRQRVALGITLVVPLIVSFGLVNPIARGLSVITQSDLSMFLRSHSDLTRLKWIVISTDISSANYVVAHGLDVWNSFHVIPDLERLRLLDPQDEFAHVYNSSGYFMVVNGPPDELRFERVRAGFAKIRINVNSDDLSQLGIEIVAARDKLSNVSPNLVLLNEDAVDGFWIYWRK